MLLLVQVVVVVVLVVELCVNVLCAWGLMVGQRRPPLQLADVGVEVSVPVEKECCCVFGWRSGMEVLQVVSKEVVVAL